jgi:hypothetical protein
MERHKYAAQKCDMQPHKRRAIVDEYGEIGRGGEEQKGMSDRLECGSPTDFWTLTTVCQLPLRVHEVIAPGVNPGTVCLVRCEIAASLVGPAHKSASSKRVIT